jgi:hypothetical protein
MSLSVQLDQKLANALMGHPQFFDDLAPPRGPIQQFEQATSGGAGEPVVAPRSIGNRVEAAGFAAPRRTPSLGRVLFGKPELGQRAQCGAGLRESEPRFHRDPGLGFRCHVGARSGKPPATG